MRAHWMAKSSRKLICLLSIFSSQGPPMQLVPMWGPQPQRNAFIVRITEGVAWRKGEPPRRFAGNTHHTKD